MFLKEYLEKKKIGIFEAAYKLGVHPQTIARWLEGSSLPAPDHRKLIAEFSKGEVTEHDLRLKRLRYADPRIK